MGNGVKTLKVNVNTYWYGLLEDKSVDFDYREAKPYWTKRLTTCRPNETDADTLNNNIKQYDEIEFFIPYTTKKLRYEIASITAHKGIDVGLKMGACFIIKLGKRI